MANPEHVEIVKQGAKAIEKWRRNHNKILDLRDADLSSVNLHSANLISANLRDADLISANLHSANLRDANLISANLRDANLISANLHSANLRDADLRSADLSGANLSYANLSSADLTSAFLYSANLLYAKLLDANLNEVDLFETIFAKVDLSKTKGLKTANHEGPSNIEIDTLYSSGGKIPEEFLHGCGVPDSLIEYLPSLIGSMEAIQYYSCFISYSGRDEDFTKRLHSRMVQAKMRVWFAPEDIKGGKKLHEEIDTAIKMHDKLLLVLSETSIQSDWVAREIRRARQREVREKRRVLFPIRIVSYEALQDWELLDAKTGTDLANEVLEYYIPDFSSWKDHDSFETEFTKLLDAMKEEPSATEPT